MKRVQISWLCKGTNIQHIAGLLTKRFQLSGSLFYPLCFADKIFYSVLHGDSVQNLCF